RPAGGSTGSMEPMTRRRLVLTALALALLAGGATASGAAAPSRGTLPGLMVGQAPWGPGNGVFLRARLKAIGLHALLQEGLALHTHQHLDIVVNGRVLRQDPPAY